MTFPLLFLLSSGAFAQGASPVNAIKKLKAVTDSIGFVKNLKELGLSDAILKKYNRYPPLMGRSLFERSHFVRAEYFKTQLFRDQPPSYVSQVIFSTGAQRLDRKVYFVFAHLQQNGRLIPVKVLDFEIMVCDWIANAGVTFRFEQQPGKQEKKILFDIIQVESCGDQVVAYNRCDTLSLLENPPLYKRGERRNVEQQDRFQKLDSINAYIERRKKR